MTMNRTTVFWKAAAAAFFAVLMLIGLCTVGDYTGSYDELAEQGILLSNMKEYALALEKAGLSSEYWLELDVLPISQSVEKDHGISGYYLYGLLFPLLEEHETIRHTLWSVVTWLWFMLGVWSLYAMARQLGMSPLLSMLAALVLWLSPRFFADGHLNNKDVVVLSLMLATLWRGLCLLQKPCVGNALAFSLVGAMAVNTKIVAVVAWGLIVICLLLQTLLQKRWKDLWLATAAAASFALCYAALTPAMWADPAGFLPYLLSNAAAFARWSGRIFFRGASFQIPENPLPVYYLAYMMLVTIPPYVFVLWLIGQLSVLCDFFRKPVAFMQNPRSLLLAAATGCWVAGMGAFVVLRPLVYNGWRHFYFTFAGGVVLAGYGIHVLWNWCRKHRKLKTAVACVLALCFASTAVGMILNHPNQSSYYNVLASRQTMETDYWNTSGTHALKRLMACEERNTELPLEVGCYFLDLQNARFKMTPEEKAQITTTVERDAPYLYYIENYVQVYDVPQPLGYHVLFQVESYGRLIGTMYERDH